MMMVPSGWVCAHMRIRVMWGQSKGPGSSKTIADILIVFFLHVEESLRTCRATMFPFYHRFDLIEFKKNAGALDCPAARRPTHPRWTVRMCRWIPEEVLRTFSQFFHKHLNITFMEFCKRQWQGMIDDVPECFFSPFRRPREGDEVAPYEGLNTTTHQELLERQAWRNRHLICGKLGHAQERVCVCEGERGVRRVMEYSIYLHDDEIEIHHCCMYDVWCVGVMLTLFWWLSGLPQHSTHQVTVVLSSFGHWEKLAHHHVASPVCSYCNTFGKTSMWVCANTVFFNQLVTASSAVWFF